MIKIKTMLNAHEFLPLGEVYTLPSLTIPDQTMSIREILDRYANGMPIGGMRVPVFDEENTLPDPRMLDFAEIDELASKFEAEIKEIRSKADELKARNELLLRQQREEDELMRKAFREKGLEKTDKDNLVVQKGA